ncbi:MAG: hypothetical protein J0I41_23280 [Filimonas sp.]|nr:hypothetical protein [Filimonas sp.]
MNEGIFKNPVVSQPDNETALMPIKYIRILIMAFWLCSMACNTAPGEQPVSLLPPPESKPNTAIPTTEKWKAIGNIWTTGELILNPGGTFSYYTRTCLGHFYTEGNWYRFNNVVEVKSFERYKDSSTVMNILAPHINDTLKPYIGNVSFRLQADSLVYVAGDSILKGQTFQKIPEAGY